MSFKKLNWIQKGEIQITSGFHGSFQNINNLTVL